MGGCTYQGEDIPSAWASYFESLATPSNQDYDESFRQLINAKYESLLELSVDDFTPLTEEEVDEAVQPLKLGKAAGPDGIEPEHLVFGGRSLAQHLTRLFNAILLSGHIPPVYQQGQYIIPIPKSHTKDLSNPSNYRGITILSNISKVLEKLILLRIHLQDSPPSLNPLQGGFRQGYGCTHTAYVLQEAIQSLREKSRKAYVAFLDVRKAFNTVWQAGLLIKLHQKGIKGHLQRLINNWYRTASSTVLWAQQASRPLAFGRVEFCPHFYTVCLSTNYLIS